MSPPSPAPARDAFAAGDTIEAVLRRAAVAIERGSEGFRSETPRLDAELLLAEVLGCSRARLLADLREPLAAEPRARFEALAARRAAGEPVAYLLGRAAFHGIELQVTPAVLVPRPETELLVDRALDWIAARRAAMPVPRAPLRAIDVGTGSGAIALALLAALREQGPIGSSESAAQEGPPALELLAVDLSPEALAVARGNADRLGLAGALRFALADLLPPDLPPLDLILANLPYVATRDRHLVGVDVDRHEPHLALYAGSDGLDLLRRLIDRLPTVLAPGGLALLEIGYDQGPAVLALAAERLPEARRQLYRDLAGHERILGVQRPPFAPRREPAG